MITNNINIFSFIANKEGFGINTDIFETNILNLSVVIGVLVYYGRIVLGDIISSRRENILKSLQDAENKFKEAEENLAFARKNLELAKAKSEEIRSQGSTLSRQTAKTLLDTAEEDIKRLKASNVSAIKFEEEKSINEICQKLTQKALKEAIENINKKVNPSIHKKIISQNIEKLSSKSLIS